MGKKYIAIFLFFVLLIALYLYRLHTFPYEDKIFEAIAIKTKSSDKQIFKIKIIEEPDDRNYQSRLKGKIIASCGLERIENFSNCSALHSNTYIQFYLKKNENRKDEVAVDDIVFVRGSLQKIKTAEPGFAHYLKREKIFYEIKSASLIKKIRPEFSVKRNLIILRKTIEASIARVIPRPHSDLAQGLIISGKGSLSDELLNQFRRVGLIHIVVLSGFNVSIIASALMAMLKPLPRLAQTVIGILGMSGFAIMTGASPPVVRSVLMSSIPLIFSSWKVNGLALLLITGYLMSLYNPYYPIYDISFQLSFMATLGLVLFTERIANCLRFIPTLFGMREVVSSSLATQVTVFPLLLHISGELSTVFLLANLLVLPVLPLVMFQIFASSLLSFISLKMASFMAFLATELLSGILWIVKLLSSLSFASIKLEPIDIHSLLITYATIFGIFLSWISLRAIFRRINAFDTEKGRT